MSRICVVLWLLASLLASGGCTIQSDPNFNINNEIEHAQKQIDDWEKYQKPLLIQNAKDYNQQEEFKAIAEPGYQPQYVREDGAGWIPDKNRR